MKKLKQIIQDVKTLITENKPDELNSMLWQLICYPPKMPLRLHQEQLFTYFIKCNDLSAADQTTVKTDIVRPQAGR